MLSKPIVRFLPAILALLAPLSCRENNTGGRGDVMPDLKEVSLTVSIAPLTRAAISGDKLIWEAGDSISVFDGYGSRVFKCNEGGASVVFTGKACPADSYGAAWPASSACAYAPGKFSVVIPAVQKAVMNSIPEEAYPVCGAADASETIVLSPVAALVEMTIEPGNEAIGQLTLTAGKSELLSGRVIITLGGDVPPVVLGDASKASLLPENESLEPGTYYLALNPSLLSNGLDMSIESAYYAPYHKHLDISGGKIVKGGSISLGSFNPAEERVEEEPDDTTTDPSSAYGFDFKTLGQMHHPRLIMDADAFVRLKKMIFLEGEANPVLVQLHNATIGYADNVLIDTDEIENPVGAKGDVLNIAKDALGRMFTLSYAYRTTGDARYLASARQNLARLCSFDSWYPQSYLSAAEFQMGVAIAYDWLYYELTLEERTAARQAICTLGLGSCPAEHFANKSNNWNQVCNAGLLSSAIAVYEKSKTLAAYHIDATVAANLHVLDVIYGQDGSYPEGYGYWEYGTDFQAVLTQELLTVFGSAGGIETHPGLLKTGKWYLYMSDAIGTFPYSDGGRSTPSPSMATWWLAGLCKDPSILFNDIWFLGQGRYRNSSRLLPFAVCALATHPEIAAGPFDPPAEKLWSGNGTTAMFMVRDGWNNDENDVFLAMKGGPANTNHGHMDAGSFVYDRFGVRWVDEILLTGGYAHYEVPMEELGGSFWSMGQGSMRWDAFVMNNLSHPTLSFANNDGSVADKVHETDHCVSGKATLLEEIRSYGLLGGKLNMTPVFKGQVASATRSGVLNTGLDAEITDEITALAGQDALLLWRVPTKTEVSVEDDCIEMRSGTKEMYLYTVCSDPTLTPIFQDFGNTRPTGQWGWVARSWDQGMSAYHIVGYTLTIPAGKTVTLKTTLSPTAPGQTSGIFENERPEM